MIWKLIKNPMTGQDDVVWRELDDGRQESCSVLAEEYLVWLSEGNQPLPADVPL